ncbi:type I-F CRISPR-associated protein Csy3 [Verminephrobacter eiseniae]|uniref:CRISPR-associated protein, Csy3 family n=1 Tax=Verminephrobacter eiseniae (strain EF01-2) TaxID=391735 RepID=A1WHV9_VEREI|nr:CRISPR-associated protein, Csy3 family [Verminephrobacter eiseniae EF01-2]MCW5282845.1 type I-F CRISPR-associated protein Csy3 [Verminephrobacter eiseniae]MCW5303161.1 type I-F CRISPR-associated protein Csy3 [Verminephrobacter eiseniae]MCW8179901.1 type I-F CRISPR-associated protein Csy3 [Verminephrobacter eiseniae]MCW8189297.1 type I-F CRISPR-associated protein Csy3 [Verminephrobacter eiseniae]
MSNNLKTASVLAFERKLDPSDATLHAGNWDNRNNTSGWNAVSIRPKSVRGTISNRLKTKDQDPAKLDAAIENPNLQTVDVAMLPSGADTLKIQFTLRVLAGTGTPSACNNAEYQAKLKHTVQGYVAKEGFTELAKRYAANLANGRFLWRNRLGAENVQVEVALLQDGKEEQSWSFDALTLDLRKPDVTNDDVLALGAVIASGLAGERRVLLQVTAFVRQGAGQEVFPSQELILDKGSNGKSKTLYHVNGVAAIHSQKIGNALRTIDTWYEGASDLDLGPIAVEPYGSVTTQGKAYRQPKQKQDFYTLLDNWLLKDQEPPMEQQHFVMAVLIRGGVFGDAS